MQLRTGLETQGSRGGSSWGLTRLSWECHISWEIKPSRIVSQYRGVSVGRVEKLGGWLMR